MADMLFEVDDCELGCTKIAGFLLGGKSECVITRRRYKWKKRTKEMKKSGLEVL